MRRLTVADAEELFFLRSNEKVLAHLHKEPAKNKEEVIAFINQINEFITNNESILWAIALKENPSLCIGTICLWNIRKEHSRAEIGYLLHPAWWQKGIMKEAMTPVIDYGFTVMRIHSIDAVVDAANEPSAKALQASGFVKEAHFKEDFYFKGRFYDTIVYSLLNKS